MQGENFKDVGIRKENLLTMCKVTMIMHRQHHRIEPGLFNYFRIIRFQLRTVQGTCHWRMKVTSLPGSLPFDPVYPVSVLIEFVICPFVLNPHENQCADCNTHSQAENVDERVQPIPIQRPERYDYVIAYHVVLLSLNWPWLR